MKEIRIHGRGGQGSLVLAQFMAIAALKDGKYGQAFPFLGGGGERRGKAIMAFCRLSDRPIRLRCKIANPDYVIVQDPTIINEVDVLGGLRPGGLLLINSDKTAEALGFDVSAIRVVTISADELARAILGKPIINTALLGTFAGVTKELSLDAVLSAVRSKFPGSLGEKNAHLVQTCFRRTMKEI
ncbi:MAG: 2-oxoacid:acceptor oxidoreductase family protein [Pseudomonadota bacterium]|nr:2-oxoacid:acceptor oxidoreductase family protein [Pseudomonadota bacterium]MBU1570254.1 2-oxoacid:acceptor oxidoreductase family protein [Pseudomonadota bacterium]